VLESHPACASKDTIGREELDYSRELLLVLFTTEGLLHYCRIYQFNVLD
jgi:hypothetical protein